MLLTTNSRRGSRHANLAAVMLQQEQQATALMAQRMLSIREVAASCGVNVAQVRLWRKRGYLQAFRSGPRGHWRIPITELARLKGA